MYLPSEQKTGRRSPPLGMGGCVITRERMGRGSWNEVRESMPGDRSLSPLNKHRHNHMEILIGVSGLEHAGAGCGGGFQGYRTPFQD